LTQVKRIGKLALQVTDEGRAPVRLDEGEAPQGGYPRGAWAPARRPANGMNEDRDIPRFGADENDIDHPAEG
jgi:hypothetical protein